MECYACSNQATRQCRRCARVFCELHGGDLCAECLSPASSLPSFNVYRGSLLALLIGTAIALWLIVRPPGSSNGREVIIASNNPTPAVTQVVRTGTPRATTTPGATVEPQGTQPPATAPATPTASRPNTYTVLPGDNLSDIAARFAPLNVSAADYAERIAAASGLSSLDDIHEGQVLTLP